MLTVTRSGKGLLNNPLLNRGTAFIEAERDTFALHDLLVPALDEQVSRWLDAFHNAKDDLARHALMRELRDTNETLFHALITRHIEEMMPIVHTPTAGRGCQCCSHLYRKPRGLFLSPPHCGRIG